jgi:hypothetical protein
MTTERKRKKETRVPSPVKCPAFACNNSRGNRPKGGGGTASLTRSIPSHVCVYPIPRADSHTHTRAVKFSSESIMGAKRDGRKCNLEETIIKIRFNRSFNFHSPLIYPTHPFLFFNLEKRFNRKSIFSSSKKCHPVNRSETGCLCTMILIWAQTATHLIQLYISVYNNLNCKKIKQNNLIRENSQEPFSDASVVTTVAISPGTISSGRLWCWSSHFSLLHSRHTHVIRWKSLCGERERASLSGSFWD